VSPEEFVEFMSVPHQISQLSIKVTKKEEIIRQLYQKFRETI